MILIAPTLFAASIYMELGRIILLVDGEHHAIIRKRWLTKIFVVGDVRTLAISQRTISLTMLDTLLPRTVMGRRPTSF